MVFRKDNNNFYFIFIKILEAFHKIHFIQINNVYKIVKQNYLPENRFAHEIQNLMH